MKGKHWGIGVVVAGSWIASLAMGGERDMVSISASVLEMKSDGTSQVIARPSLVVQIGKRATYRDGGEMMFPSEFTLPNIPEEFAADAKIKGEVDAKPKWTTNRHRLAPPQTRQDRCPDKNP